MNDYTNQIRQALSQVRSLSDEKEVLEGKLASAIKKGTELVILANSLRNQANLPQNVVFHYTETKSQSRRTGDSGTKHPTADHDSEEGKYKAILQKSVNRIEVLQVENSNLEENTKHALYGLSLLETEVDRLQKALEKPCTSAPEALNEEAEPDGKEADNFGSGKNDKKDSSDDENDNEGEDEDEDEEEVIYHKDHVDAHGATDGVSDAEKSPSELFKQFLAEIEMTGIGKLATGEQLIRRCKHGAFPPLLIAHLRGVASAASVDVDEAKHLLYINLLVQNLSRAALSSESYMHGRAVLVAASRDIEAEVMRLLLAWIPGTLTLTDSGGPSSSSPQSCSFTSQGKERPSTSSDKEETSIKTRIILMALCCVKLFHAMGLPRRVFIFLETLHVIFAWHQHRCPLRSSAVAQVIHILTDTGRTEFSGGQQDHLLSEDARTHFTTFIAETSGVHVDDVKGWLIWPLPDKTLREGQGFRAYQETERCRQLRELMGIPDFPSIDLWGNTSSSKLSRNKVLPSDDVGWLNFFKQHWLSRQKMSAHGVKKDVETCFGELESSLYVTMLQYSPERRQWLYSGASACMPLSPGAALSHITAMLHTDSIQEKRLLSSSKDVEIGSIAEGDVWTPLHQAELTNFSRADVASLFRSGFATARHAYLMELWTALVALSLRGLLEAYTSEPLCDPSVAMAAMVMLSNIPAPWGGAENPEVVRIVVRATQCLTMSSCGRDPSYNLLSMQGSLHGRAIGHFLSTAMSYMPALVINLDRRRDRWHKLCTMAAQHGLAPIRIGAYDATLFRKVDEDMTTVTTAATALDTMVVTHWDSTLNSSFDTTCRSIAAMPMTMSERACAASHTRVWRIIAGQPNDPLEQQKVKELALHGGLRGGHMTPTSLREGTDVAASDPDGEWFLILEDDAYVCQYEFRYERGRRHSAGVVGGRPLLDFQHRVRRAVDALPTEADLLYLGRAIPPSGRGPRQSGGLFKVKYAWQLHAYMIRRKTARFLLRELPVDAPADNFIASRIHDGSLTAYATEFQLMRQPRLDSQAGSDINHSGRLDSGWQEPSEQRQRNVKNKKNKYNKKRKHDAFNDVSHYD